MEETVVPVAVQVQGERLEAVVPLYSVKAIQADQLLVVRPEPVAVEVRVPLAVDRQMVLVVMGFQVPSRAVQ